MEKHKYTFEDWKSGKLWYEVLNDLPVPHGLNYYNESLYGDDSRADFEFHRKDLNNPALMHDWGDLDALEFEKIRQEQTRLFKLILDEQVEIGMKPRLRVLEPLWEDKVLIQARLNSLEKWILEDGRGEILFNIRRGTLPRLDNLTGPEYLKINGSASARGEYLKRRPESVLSRYVEVALLEAERAHIRQSLGQSITKKEIYRRYDDLLKKKIKPKDAFPLIEAWLTVENGYTIDQVKSLFNVTLEYDSFTRSARNNINPATKTAHGKKGKDSESIR